MESPIRKITRMSWKLRPVEGAGCGPLDTVPSKDSEYTETARGQEPPGAQWEVASGMGMNAVYPVVRMF